jgi:hypothetical protein
MPGIQISGIKSILYFNGAAHRLCVAANSADIMMNSTANKTAIMVAMIMLTACSPQAASGTDVGEPPTAKTDTHPAWIKSLISEYESQPIANPQREIIRYKFDGKIVYYVPPICCDIPSQLFTDEGKLMCYPDGGFTGRGDERCPTFHKLKTDEQRVWKDPRARPDSKKPL